jgi:rod shape-determining protein MreC
VVLPSGQRAIVAGDNTAYPVLEFLEAPDSIRPGDRIVSSGDGGLYPPDILIGRVATTPDGRHRALIAADYGRLDYVRVIRFRPSEQISGPGDMIGPMLAAQPSGPVGEPGQ